ncbi:oxidoreductase-like protein [Mycena rebaudengoi]|nr:oxidoreductase-like protein [Mycena rebaudengoi]
MLQRFFFSSRSTLYFPSLFRYISDHAVGIERIKNPTRGGQNLSQRYRRLERSLRGKEALNKDICTLESEKSAVSAPAGASPQELDASRYFGGFEIPQRPKEPESDECCMSGCAICVYDLYDESMAAYKDSIAALRVSLERAEIPQSQWPEAVRKGEKSGGSTPSVTLSAFEQLEKALKEKKAGGDGKAQ